MTQLGEELGYRKEKKWVGREVAKVKENVHPLLDTAGKDKE